MTSTNRVNEFRARNRWYRPLEYAQRRCKDPNHASYPLYGGRGIQCTLTKAQAKFLYERDHGDTLQQPSLDRIDPDGPYSVDNCRFIEYRENCKHKRFRVGDSCDTLS